MVVECAKPQLELFEPKTVQYSIMKTEQVILKPQASIEGSTMIQFLDQGYGDDYKNLNSIYLILKVKMISKNNDGTEIKTKLTAATLPVAPVNNTLHSMFRQIILTLNGTQIGQNTQNYPYRAYIDNLLNYEESSAAQHLAGIIFKADTPKHFEKITSENAGASERGLLFQPDEEVELVGRLHLDMLNTKKFMLNNVDIGLTFELHRPEFYLMKTTDTNTSSLKIIDATLFIDHVKLNPEVALAHQRILDSGSNAIYNYKRCEIRNHLVSEKSSSFAWDNVCNGNLPEFVLICMTETNSFNGDVTKNPFNFQHFNLQSFTASLNGIEIPPRNLSFDFSPERTNPCSQHAYFSLFKQLNLHRFDKANLIDKEFYNNGGFILAYDLTPDRDIDCTNFLNSGALRFEGKFRKAIPSSITIIAYLQYDADLVIDKDRHVYPSNL